MKTKHKINCPVCKGLGKIQEPQFRKDILKQKEKATKILRKSGFSFREIMRIMSYKSPGSVRNWLNKK